MLSNIQRERRAHVPHVQAKYSIISAVFFMASQRRLETAGAEEAAAGAPEFHVVDSLKREGETTLNRALGLGEVERAAVAGEEGTIALRKQIANVD